MRIRLWQSLTYSGAAREALFVKLASDLCDLWPDSHLAASTLTGEIPSVASEASELLAAGTSDLT